jgi:hypothetical protein
MNNRDFAGAGDYTARIGNQAGISRGRPQQRQCALALSQRLQRKRLASKLRTKYIRVQLAPPTRTAYAIKNQHDDPS